MLCYMDFSALSKTEAFYKLRDNFHSTVINIESLPTEGDSISGYVYTFRMWYSV